MNLAQYLVKLQEEGGNAWNQFWFQTHPPRPLAHLRIGAGIMAIFYFCSWCGVLGRWFGAKGLLPTAAVESILTMNGQHHYHFSPLFYLSGETELNLFLGFAIACGAIPFALGLFSRWTGFITYVALLSFVHRAPMITGPFETVLAMLLFYLPWGPCSASCSLDARRKRAQPEPSLMANMVLRLIQLHTCGFVLLVGYSLLAGETWWNGTAIWVLEAQTSSRPFNLSWLRNYPFLLNAWSHAFVSVNLLFPILIWIPLLRPVVLAVTIALWLSLLPISGQWAYIGTMILAMLSFWITPESMTEQSTEPNTAKKAAPSGRAR